MAYQMHDKIGGKKEEVFSSLHWSLQYTHELCHLIMESRDDVQVNSLQNSSCKSENVHVLPSKQVNDGR